MLAFAVRSFGVRAGWLTLASLLAITVKWCAALLLVGWALAPLPARATLVLSSDGLTVYDTVNDVTWLADANLAATNRFGLPVCDGSGTQPCVNASGSMNYQSAAAWVQAMNAANYLGHTNWQLPTTPSIDNGCGKTGPNGDSFGFGCSASALGSLYYDALGLRAPNTAIPIPNNMVGPFSNFQPYLYWSQTNGGGNGYATFSFDNGFHGANTAPNFLYVLPMIQGKIPGTPAAIGNGLQVNPGGQTIYDPLADVTWLANANVAATNTFGLPSCQSPTSPAICVNPDGAMTWDSADQFVKNMNTAGYLGQTSWQLPPIDPSCSGYNCTSGSKSPMGELFYGQLGLSYGTPVIAAPNIAVGPFNHLQPYLYWSCLGATIQDACEIDGPVPNQEWSFSFGNGFEGTDILPNDLYATAYFVGPLTSVASPTERPTSPVLPTSSPTATASATVAHSVTPTASVLPTPSRNATPTASETPMGACTGDCDGDGQVTVDEILTLVNIALGSKSVTTCERGDANRDGQITVDEILAAVRAAVNGCTPQAVGAADFYVAPNGSDAWSGTLPAPDSTMTDGPFATFDRVRTAVQSLNKTGLKQVVVQFRAGTYFLPATEQFTAADSGSASTGIAYENYPGESPVISGGVRVQNWAHVGGNTWRATLPPSTPYFENLFYNGARRLRPRLGGYLGTYLRIAGPVYLNAPGPPATAPDPNCSIYVTGSGWQCFDRFQYNPSDPITDTWRNLAPPEGNLCNQPAGNPALAGDVELLVFEKFEAAKLRISCVDTAKHIVYLTGPTLINPAFYTALGFIATHRYLVENVQDQLSQPGQWFLDRSVTPWTLTYLANNGENPNTDTVIVPQLTQVLVASNLEYVTFQGLTFEDDNYTVPPSGVDPDLKLGEITAALSFQNSRHITFDSGIVAHTSGAGLDFTSCIMDHAQPSPPWCVSTSSNAVTSGNVVQNSAFYDIGSTAVRIGIEGRQADTDADIPQFTTVENNVVEGYGRVFPGSYGITQGQGHDNLYTHNDVYDGYRAAIGICFCSGYKPDSHDNTISFNHVHGLLQGIMNDDGSLYIQTRNQQGASPPGNKILNNKVHDVSDASALDADGYGGDGIYIDTQTGLVDVENNLVYRVSDSAMNLAGAPQNLNEANTIKNNIFAFGRLSMVNDSNPYPNGSVPANVVQTFALTNNLFYFDRDAAASPSFYMQGGCTYSGGFPYTAWQQWNSNLYWRAGGGFANDAEAFHVQPDPVSQFNLCFGEAAKAKWTFYTFANWQKAGEDVQSVVQNPGFKDPAYPADDYSLPGGSPGVGFTVFDPNQAGRSNPTITPPAVPATFPTKNFNSATDY